MKHSLTVTWESQWTSDEVLQGDPADSGDWAVISGNAEHLVRDWVDKDAQGMAVSVDGVMLGRPARNEEVKQHD